jgi:C1A family cysteine protease
MNKFVLALALLPAAFAAPGVATHYTTDPAVQKQKFEAFKTEFAKKYETPGLEAKAFNSFVENLKLIDERNKVDTAEHGLTKFSDMSQSEFEANLLTYFPPSMTEEEMAARDRKIESKKTSNAMDWAGVLTTDVKDQGYCGSCWAFSATEQIESDAMRVFKDSNPDFDFQLAPQQITSCDEYDGGCNGGNTETAYRYVEEVRGLENEKDYPYVDGLGVSDHSIVSSRGTSKCDAAPIKEKVGISDWSYVGRSDEATMADYIGSTGPLSICVDASSWNSYKSGVLTNCGHSLDHCVQLVGMDLDASTPYWKVRNSWGTSWGEDGFIRLEYGKSMCALDNDPTTVVPTMVGFDAEMIQKAQKMAKNFLRAGKMAAKKN